MLNNIVVMLWSVWFQINISSILKKQKTRKQTSLLAVSFIFFILEPEIMLIAGIFQVEH